MTRPTQDGGVWGSYVEYLAQLEAQHDRLQTDYDMLRRSVTTEVEAAEDRAGRHLTEARTAETERNSYQPVIQAADQWAAARDPIAQAAAAAVLLAAVTARQQLPTPSTTDTQATPTEG